MLNPEVLKCHEDLITLETYVQQRKTIDNKFFICENINIFGYLEAWWGGGVLQQSDWAILVHIYLIFYIYLHVKYRINMIITFWVLK